MYNGGNRVVGGKRIQVSVEIHIRSVDPYPSAGRVQDFHIRMDLCDRNSQRRSSIDDCVFAE
jgi:hypothetical protein